MIDSLDHDRSSDVAASSRLLCLTRFLRPNNLSLHLTILSFPASHHIRLPIKLHKVSTRLSQTPRHITKLTHLTTNAIPTNTKHTTIIVIDPFFQYGASVAGYITMPQNVYSSSPPMAMVYNTTARTASSPLFCRIVVAQPYMTGLTMKDVPHR